MKRVIKIWFDSEESAQKYLSRGGTMPKGARFMEVVSDRTSSSKKKKARKK